MRKKFSVKWTGSKQPRKQRKYRHNAPLHIKRKFIHSHLTKELQKKHKTKSIGVRKGDKVKIMRGQNKGKSGKVERVDTRREKVYITGIEVTRREGSKVLLPIHPSNLIIQELNTEDKTRRLK
ncbi:MAG: 50S ribosomal protein L24 [Candidatus Woesearchaeota archaeon]